tara:strand:+ start:931 stop:1044 length:114 start_codon:yes stop_codon:yes gene_type:complete
MILEKMLYEKQKEVHYLQMRLKKCIEQKERLRKKNDK